MKRQFYVIAYDITSNRRRKKVADLLADWGQRVNLSVFECHLEKKQLRGLRRRITGIINHKKDVVIYYPLCLDCRAGISADGAPVYRPANHSVIVV